MTDAGVSMEDERPSLGSGILKIEDVSSKSRILALVAADFGAKGLWISRPASREGATPSTSSSAASPSPSTSTTSSDYLRDKRWVSTLNRFDEVLISLPSVAAFRGLTTLMKETPSTASLFEKTRFALPEADVKNDDDDDTPVERSVPEDATFAYDGSSSSIGGSLALASPLPCREIRIHEEDYDFDHSISKFRIRKIAFTHENNDDVGVDVRHPPISRYLLSFTEAASRDAHHRRDPYREWDLVRMFLLKRSTSCYSSSVRHPRHLLYHKTPIYLSSDVSSSRQLRACVRQTFVDGVVVASGVAFVNPGVFHPNKTCVNFKEVMESLAKILREEEEEEEEEDGYAAANTLSDWKTTLTDFWQRRIQSLTGSFSKPESHVGDSIDVLKNGVDAASAERESTSAIVSRWLARLEAVESMKDLRAAIDSFLGDESSSSFLTLACVAAGSDNGRLSWRTASLEELKATKKTKLEKFEMKKEKLKENGRRKKEIAKLRRRFVRMGEMGDGEEEGRGKEGEDGGGVDANATEEIISDDGDDDDYDGGGEDDRRAKRARLSSQERQHLPMRERVPREEKPQFGAGEPLRRAEAQTLERRRIRSSLLASRSDDQVMNVLKVAIDVSFGDGVMSDKEMGRLAIQIRRLYGANRHLCGISSFTAPSSLSASETSSSFITGSSSSSSSPARLDLFGLAAPSKMREKLGTKFTGFEDTVVGKWEEGNPKAIYGRLADELEFVVLTPDSDNILTEVSASRVYIVGGLVDESVTKNLTLVKSLEWNFTTARLPIQEFMERSSRDVKCGTSFNPVLTVNQVFDILSSVFHDGDWPKALAAGVPRRKGFVLKQ